MKTFSEEAQLAAIHFAVVLISDSKDHLPLFFFGRLFCPGSETGIDYRCRTYDCEIGEVNTKWEGKTLLQKIKIGKKIKNIPFSRFVFGFLENTLLNCKIGEENED